MTMRHHELCPVHVGQPTATTRVARPASSRTRHPVVLLAVLGPAAAGAAVGVLDPGWLAPLGALPVGVLLVVAVAPGLATALMIGRVRDRRRATRASRSTSHLGPGAPPSGPHLSDPSPGGPPVPFGAGVDRDAAVEFLELFHSENPEAGPVEPRRDAVIREIDETGSYWHTSEELAFGARAAWRNNSRCIGRLYWRSLQVRDLRTVNDPAGVARHCLDHLRAAYNGGRIRPMISVFAPDRPTRPAPRIWNEQLIRYAGYRQPDGGVLGDPRYCDFTDELVRRGWRPPATPGHFDVLPLVVETAADGPQLFRIPREAVHEVPLEHPDLAWFADLGMRWHAVPVISNNRLEIGGVSYPASPFNGWYMGTEIGARNLADSDRYDLVPEVADRMGLDTSDEATLWRDRALVEINRAVLHSFRARGVTITDHHTESQRFLIHLEREEQTGRGCPADWSWIVPPMSGSQTPVFHRYYDDEDLVPNFFADDDTVSRALRGSPPAFP